MKNNHYQSSSSLNLLKKTSHSKQSFENNYESKCLIHIEESVRYFCLDCKDSCFCSCCYLEKKHQNHNVLTIESAWIKIRDEELICETKNKINQILRDSTHLNDIIYAIHKEILLQLDECKKYIEAYVSELIQVLQNEKDKLLNNLKLRLDKAETYISNSKHDIKSNYDLLKNTICEYEYLKSLFSTPELSRRYHLLLKNKKNDIDRILDSNYIDYFIESNKNQIINTDLFVSSIIKLIQLLKMSTSNFNTKVNCFKLLPKDEGKSLDLLYTNIEKNLSIFKNKIKDSIPKNSI